MAASRRVSSAEHAGETYLIIHSTAFPGGEIRGFLAVPGPPCWFARSNLGERWLLVATAAENHLSRNPHTSFGACFT
jgi:hypothetical protein